MPDSRFDRAISRFDNLNRQDPRTDTHAGKSWPREFLHATKVSEWVIRLDPVAPESLRLAARCNAVRRWDIPRESHPRTTAGYHAWRAACRKHHARIAENILGEEGYAPDEIRAVTDLVQMKRFPADPRAQTLEDADCLTFLETKFHAYLAEWDETKIIRILKKTIGKMSPKAQSLGMMLELSPEARALIEKSLR